MAKKKKETSRMDDKKPLSAKHNETNKQTKTSWNSDVKIENSEFDDAVGQPLKFEPVLAEEIVDQVGVSLQDEENMGSTSAHPGIAQNLANDPLKGLTKSKRHLLVPVNVQAYVVPPSKPELKKSKAKDTGKDTPSKLSSLSVDDSHAQMADLNTAYRPVIGSDDEELAWDLPGPFDYKSSDPSKSGHPAGIHLLWSLPKALLTGKMKAKSTLTEAFSGVEMDESGYIDPDEFVPIHFIPCDEGFEHPLTFKQAVENRIEFMTEDDSEITNLNELFEYRHLPDLWIVVRNGKKSARKSWMVDSVTLEVSPLSSFSQSLRNAKIPEMTAVGPNDGDFYWSATYDNAKGRFTFHDLPEANEIGPFDYFVCGWYSDSTSDPAHMEANTAEEVWFKYVKEELGWSIDRNDVDNDWYIGQSAFNFFKGGQNFES